MEPTQLITLILTSSVVGGVTTKLIGIIRDAIAGHLQKRRAEVDKAIRERDRAKVWTHILEESLRVHRRMLIDAPCVDVDELPTWPTKPRD